MPIARSSNSPLPAIGTLVGTPVIGPDIVRQLASVGHLVFTDTVNELVQRASDGEFAAIIVPLATPDGRGIAPLILSLTTHAAAIPVIIYDRLNDATVATLREALVPGIEFVIHPFEPLGPVVRQAVDSSFPPTVGPSLLQHVLPLAPPPLHRFLTVAALKSSSRRGVAQLARWSGTPPRTLERRFSAAGWQTATTVLQSFRALDVLWLMAEYGWSTRQVQTARGFSNPSAITRLIHRHVGMTPTAIKDNGGFATALHAVLHRISGAR